MERESLNRMTRDELIAYARRMGVERAEVMTRAELADEILRLSETDAPRRQQLRGWFGVARDLLAGVVEQGLHLPDAAKLIRGDTVFQPRVQAPIATVTLAEIYASQGHAKRALSLLEQVLAKEADHDAARRLRDQLLAGPPSPPAVAPETARAGTWAVNEESNGSPATPSSEPPPAEPSTGEAISAAAADATESVVRDTLPPPDPDASDGTSPEATPEAVPTADTRVQAEAPPASEPEDVLRDTVPPPPPVAAEPPPTAADQGDDPGLDAVFVVTAGARSHCVYWELSRATRSRSVERAGSESLVVKLLFLTPHPDGTQRADRDLCVTGPRGAVTVETPSSRALVRAALGWKSATGFSPLAVADQIGPLGQARTWVPSTKASERVRTAKERALAAYRAAGLPG